MYLNMSVPTTQFTSGISSDDESTVTTIINFILSKPYLLNVTANIAASSVNAVYGVNYSLETNSITISARATTASITFNNINDNVSGIDKTVTTYIL